MTTTLRMKWRDRVSDWRPIARRRGSDSECTRERQRECERDPEGNPTEDQHHHLNPEQYEHVASYGGQHHVVHIDDRGDIHVHRRKFYRAEAEGPHRTTDKTHAERLKELAARMRKFWERKS